MTEMLQYQLQNFSPITLSQMEDVKLMNRIDTKYVTNRSAIHRLLPLLQKEYFIQEIDGARVGRYHTIYYDTPDKSMYMLHHNGKKEREKIRTREYLDTNQTFLEIKDKNNKGRTKKIRISIPDHRIEVNRSASEFINDKSLFTHEILEPHIENYFDRLTLVNFDRTERLTIDMNIRFCNYDTGITKKLDDIAVIELKQDGNHHSPFRILASMMRIHKASFSKYCIGAALTNEVLKQNRFKKHIMYINKITKI